MASRRTIFGVAAVGAVAYAAYALSGPNKRHPADVIKTPGVKNIEKRYASGGASPDHTPGAASPRGDHANVDGRSEGTNGWANPKFKEQVGEMSGGTKVFGRADPSARPDQKKEK